MWMYFLLRTVKTQQRYPFYFCKFRATYKVQLLIKRKKEKSQTLVILSEEKKSVFTLHTSLRVASCLEQFDNDGFMWSHLQRVQSHGT